MIKERLNSIRSPEQTGSRGARIAVSAGIALTGVALGVFQKWLDTAGIDVLPFFLQRFDIVNYFGRLAVWILAATMIAVWAETPLRASINTILFFAGMLSGYYCYCKFVLGFLPVSYMMFWVGMTVASFFLAFVCWYAKGRGAVAVVISGTILGVLFSQAFLITQGFYVTHALEVVTWLAGIALLWRRKPKELAAELAVCLAAAVVYQLLIPYWG